MKNTFRLLNLTSQKTCAAIVEIMLIYFMLLILRHYHMSLWSAGLDYVASYGVYSVIRFVKYDIAAEQSRDRARHWRESKMKTMV